jgi:hypothetical protein
MFAYFAWRESAKPLVVGISLLLAQVSVGQDQPTLLRLQRSRATLDIDATGGARGQGGNVYSIAGNPASMGVSSYPNTASCILVYNDGRYVLEKRDEHKIGRPKITTAEGTLSGDDLQQLRSILNNDELKKITDLKAVEPPPNAQALREAETLDIQISREGVIQHFIAAKERFKTEAVGTSAVATAPSTGLDTYLDNATAFRKTLNPLIKWFDGLEKKSKSSIKESKPQYCMPMNIG